MHLQPSTIDINVLLEAARTRRLPNYESSEVQAFYVAPDQDVEIFDRIQESEHGSNLFVTAEWVGEEPTYIRDGRHYRRRYSNIRTCRITFESSVYRLRPVSVVLQSKQDGDLSDFRAVTFRIIICDTDNRLGLPAFIEEELKVIEEGEMKEFPVHDEQRVLVHA